MLKVGGKKCLPFSLQRHCRMVLCQNCSTHNYEISILRTWQGASIKTYIYMPHFKSIRCCSTTKARYIEMYQYHIYPIYFRSIAATISSITIVTIILKLKFSCKRLTLIPARSTDLLILGSAVLCPRHSNSYLGANNEQYDIHRVSVIYIHFLLCN